MPFDLLATFIRYAMMLYAGHLVSSGMIDGSQVDNIASLAVAGAAIAWFWFHKWVPSRRDGGDRDK